MRTNTTPDPMADPATSGGGQAGTSKSRTLPRGGAKRATLAQLSAYLGLSKPTLSRALNDYPDIAASTKVRVRQAAQELGYKASSRARQLSSGRAEAIGLITTVNDQGVGNKGLRSAYQSEFTNALALGLARLDHDLLLHAVENPAREVQAYERLAQEGKVDGFVVMLTRADDPRLRYLSARGIPFVTQGRFDRDQDQAWLDVDTETGFAQVTQHLIDLGHRRLAYLGGDPRIYTSGHRRAGVLRTLTQAGLEIAQDFTGDFTAEAGRRALQQALTQGLDFTALICANDAMALGAVSAAGQAGLRIPADLSITGYDGVRLGEVFNPPITTLSHCAADCGAAVASMIVRLIQGANPRALQRLVTPALVLRGSTSPPKNLQIEE